MKTQKKSISHVVTVTKETVLKNWNFSYRGGGIQIDFQLFSFFVKEKINALKYI